MGTRALLASLTHKSDTPTVQKASSLVQDWLKLGLTNVKICQIKGMKWSGIMDMWKGSF